MVWRNGFGWVDPWAGVTGSAGPYNPPGSGSAGGAGITGGASGAGGGAGITGAGGARPRSGVTVTGDAGAYDPFPWITGEAGPYDPYEGVTGSAGPYYPGGTSGDNQLSYSQFFAGSNLLGGGGGGAPNPQTNWTPYIAVGVVALVVVVVALKK